MVGLNRDPIREEGGTNLFAYVGNCPASFIDPTGLVVSQHNFDQDLVGQLNALCCQCYKSKEQVDDCKEKAKAIGRDLQDIWNRNYGTPGNPWENERENAGGFMCYDWAAAFLRIIGKKVLLAGSIVEMNAPKSGASIPQHYAVAISAGSSGSSKCTVFVDDGFLGDGTVNGANWDTSPYVDTHRYRFDTRLPHVPGLKGPF